MLAPLSIVVHQQSRELEVQFGPAEQFRLPFELMRVCSPSAEVQGHGPGQEVLQTGKRKVTVVDLEPVGNYAIRPTFSDGHDTGIFTWEYLRFLGVEKDRLWSEYLRRLEQAGASRDVEAPSADSASVGCGRH